jgi:hypothetical protein
MDLFILFLLCFTCFCSAQEDYMQRTFLQRTTTACVPSLRSNHLLSTPTTCARVATTNSTRTSSTSSKSSPISTATSKMVKTELSPSGAKRADDLPHIPPAEFRSWNRMADMMNYYHNNFRQTWNQLYAATEPGASLPASRLIALSTSFIQHLTVHHGMHGFLVSD